MKKMILACASALLVVGATSCDGKSGSTTADKTFGDSVSTYFGKVNGGMLAMRVKESPEAANWSKASMLRGIETALKADTADMGYLVGLSIGVQMAQQLKGISEDVDGFSYAKTIAAFQQAFKADSLPGLDADNIEFQKLMAQVRERAEKKRQDALENSPEAVEGTKAGEAYIAKLKAEDPEIKTTASGLSYKVVKEGKGEKPAATDVAKVKYTGKLIDGTVFDSSEGNVVDFPVSHVVPGFSEGLQLMTPGSTYIFYIPGNLAYGAQGAPQAGITPNATLTFEVELVGVDAKK